MAIKTVATNGTQRRSPALVRNGAARHASPAVPKRPARRESWKKVFERNLVRVGYSPAEAKEIVVDFAAS
jgi:hypothetical protein